jgi:hypothetical protein
MNTTKRKVVKCKGKLTRTYVEADIGLGEKGWLLSIVRGKELFFIDLDKVTIQRKLLGI